MDIKKIGMISTIVLVFLAAITASAMAAAPTAPTDVICTSHTAGVSSTKTDISIKWTASTDTDGDMEGYIIVWDNSENTVFAAGTVLSSTTTSSESLADGNWYFHIRATDAISNLSDIVTVGPFVINTQPSIAAVSPTNGAAGTQIKIYGTAFAYDASVKIGTTDMENVLVVSDTELTATVPSTLSVGTYDITVTSGGKYDTETNAFTVSSSSENNAPQISAGIDKKTGIGGAASINDATASDKDSGDNMTYTWSVLNAPAGATAGTDYMLTSTSSLNGVTFTPFTQKAKGEFTLKLTVSDGETSVSDTVLVTVGDPGLPYVISVLKVLVGNGVKVASFVSADGKITAADAVFVLIQLSKN